MAIKELEIMEAPFEEDGHGQQEQTRGGLAVEDVDEDAEPLVEGRLGYHDGRGVDGLDRHAHGVRPRLPPSAHRRTCSAT